MELITITRDKQNRPMAKLDLSIQEIDDIKKAAKDHPKYNDSDSEGIRIKGLLERDYNKPIPNIIIKDIKEVVHRYIQNNEDPESDMDVLDDKLHQVCVLLNPS